MAYDLEEQEQIDALKAWWEKNGNWISWVATAALLALAAFFGWRWYGANQAKEAAAVYDEFVKANGAKDAKSKDIAGVLLEKYGRTVYAPLAALQAAKTNFDAGDLAAAKLQLQWVAEKSGRDEYAALARVRLAGILLDEKAYDEALRVLDVTPPESHAVAFADRRGDVLAAQGKFGDAAAAYQAALAKATEQNPLRGFIQQKLDLLPAANS